MIAGARAGQAIGDGRPQLSQGSKSWCGCTSVCQTDSVLFRLAENARAIFARNKPLSKARYGLGQGAGNFGCYHANQCALNIVPRL